jgi:hypothetical protein
MPIGQEMQVIGSQLMVIAFFIGENFISRKSKKWTVVAWLSTKPIKGIIGIVLSNTSNVAKMFIFETKRYACFFAYNQDRRD